MNRKIVYIASFLLGLICLSTASFASSLMVQTNAQVELRDAPNGQAIATVTAGKIGITQEIKLPWVKVFFGDSTSNSSVKSGWLELSQLTILKSVVTGDDCETDYETGAEVCVTVDDVDLDCSEGYSGYFSSCEVEIEYSVETDLDRDDKYLDVEIECEAEIAYKRRNRSGSWESDDDDESHMLYSNGSDYGEIDLDFSFSSYQEVYSVRLYDAECEVDSVYAY